MCFHTCVYSMQRVFTHATTEWCWVYSHESRHNVTWYIFFHFEMSPFVWYKNFIKVHMKQEMLLISGTSHCVVTGAFLPTFFFPCHVFSHWTLMLFSKGFLGMWTQPTLEQIGLSFHGLWFGYLPTPSPSAKQHETTTSDSSICCRSSHFLKIMKPVLQWAPYFPTHLQYMHYLYPQVSSQLHAVVKKVCWHSFMYFK